MRHHPSFRFTASQAVQFAWLEEDQPGLFKRVQRAVEVGALEVVGGAWVEMDCNLPGGEALCRQFIYGQRWFQGKLGKRCGVGWLPDSFGGAKQCAQLPQIMRECGIKRFVTQKLARNSFNRFPNTTFSWAGLDGSSVITHFPPTGTQTATATVADIAKSVKNNQDLSTTSRSMLMYGHGDGGGGPQHAMIERLKRMADVDGMPAGVRMGTAAEFFDGVEEEILPVWKGELYFETHRGTYTSQSALKRYNRLLERDLRDVEILWTFACLTSRALAYPTAELTRLWRALLLNQFHDVLPGTGTPEVVRDAIDIYEDAERSVKALRRGAMEELCGDGARTEVVRVTEAAVRSTMPRMAQGVDEGKVLVILKDVPGMSTVDALRYVDDNFRRASASEHMLDEVVEDGDEFFNVRTVAGRRFVLENAFLMATFDGHGRLTSLYDKYAEREVVKLGQRGNVFKYFEDIPFYYDAWDVEVYHLEKGWNAELGEATIVEDGPVRAALHARHPISSTSWLEQRIVLSAVGRMVEFETRVSWTENRRILKVEFPIAVDCDYATYETAFGVVRRPTHYNTSWDLAQFEVPAHRFADLSECGYGVALLTDCKYGYSVKGNVMRLSLLRAPKSPDDGCDVGSEHIFRYALHPHVGSFAESDVLREAVHFNTPLIVGDTGASGIARCPRDCARTALSVDRKNIIIEAVKFAESPRDRGDGVRDIVVRLYESAGGRGRCKLAVNFSVLEACFCNVLEDVGSPVERDADGRYAFEYRPFSIITVRFLVATWNLSLQTLSRIVGLILNQSLVSISQHRAKPLAGVYAHRRCPMPDDRSSMSSLKLSSVAGVAVIPEGSLQRVELQRIEKAFQKEEFRKLFKDYVDEISDPKNKAQYEAEITQMERERGNDIKWIKPQPGFVVKLEIETGGKDVNPEAKKAFINMCHCADVAEAKAEKVKRKDGATGSSWNIPYSLNQPKADVDKAGKPCVVYDCVFNTATLELSKNVPKFKELLVQVASEGLERQFPGTKLVKGSAVLLKKMTRKGELTSTVIREKVNGGGSESAAAQGASGSGLRSTDDGGETSVEFLERLAAQVQNDAAAKKSGGKTAEKNSNTKAEPAKKLVTELHSPKPAIPEPRKEAAPSPPLPATKAINGETTKPKATRASEPDRDDTPNPEPSPIVKPADDETKKLDALPPTNELPTPKYQIIHSGTFSYDKCLNGREPLPGTRGGRPESIVVRVQLPGCRSVADLDLETFTEEVKLEVKGMWKLDAKLPYKVDHGNGSAKFDKKKEELLVTLPVIA
ncbi:Alpha-mannosidase 2C1 [Irineochytrium annulatum]|nr:Alpha-mannosidase 2C1 [Irineochytrium annulatum]